MAFVDVHFQGLAPDPSVESAIYRWVARLEAIQIGVARAKVTVEALGHRRVAVCLTVTLMDGSLRAADAIHPDVYLALEEAFRDLKRQARQPAPAARPRLLASA
jgi:ribosome-associated translation inhibitor RaiA